MTFNLGLLGTALPRLGLVMGLGLLVGGADLGCGGPQKKGEDLVPVSLGDWCKQVNSKLCNSVTQSCFKGMSGFAEGCLASSVPNCLEGRDGKQPSGRNKGELSECIAAIQPLSCKELGKGLGAGKIGELCGAKAPANPNWTPPATTEAPKPPADTPTDNPKPPAEEPKTTPAPKAAPAPKTSPAPKS